VKSKAKRRLLHWWDGFANAVGAAIEEGIFRASLAVRVLLGISPRTVEKRHWNRVVEAPVLIEVREWTTSRHIFSCLVWPPLEASAKEAYQAHDERVEQVKAVITRGAIEQRISTLISVDDGLSWDRAREVWVGRDGYSYPPPPAGRGSVRDLFADS
jgi:hypothetical protein